MSIRKVSAGHGYAYVLKSVANADGDRTAPDQVTWYYLEAGTPPGFWLGKGVAHLGDGTLAPGQTVTSEQLKRLIGTGRDPVTGCSLGRDFQRYKSVAERAEDRAAKLEANLTAEERRTATARIEAEETKVGDRHAVAGFDLTFSVPKSVSVLWAVADANTQALIVEAHHSAVAETLALLEKHVAATRTGHGGIEQKDVVGIAAAAYDHWDSRANDPQLHTHVVVSNKVKTVDDGVWRALDAKPLFDATVALSAHYDATLRDRLTGTFGLAWEQRSRPADKMPQWELAEVPDTLISEFSSRTHQIDACAEELVEDHVARHGRTPSSRTRSRLRARATLATRPEKQIHSLHDLTETWRTRAARLLGTDPTGWARKVTTTSLARTFTAAKVPDGVMAHLAHDVVTAVSTSKATYTHWNLWAEANRQSMGLRLASAEDREGLIAAVVAMAEDASVRLTPGERASVPAAMRRQDGTSWLRPHRGERYTAPATLEAEDRLLARAANTAASTVDLRMVDAVMSRPFDGRTLTTEQRSAVRGIAASGRQVDLLVGPAGAGKTTTMQALRAVWERAHGPGSVVGLAPSAAAAQVLSDELGIRTENTAMWLHEAGEGRAWFSRGQLVILDEATLAGTQTLDRVNSLAAEAGAKVLLVGDPAQLQSVEAGGAFALLVETRRDAARAGESDSVVPELTEVHRFRNDWEKTASLRLRDGNADVIDVYDHHDRIRGGTTEDMIDAAYAAWQTDSSGGHVALLVADTRDTVRELNERARADRLVSGATDRGQAVRLRDGLEASVGDVVVTRRNDRRLATPHDLVRGAFVRNGDRWQVTDVLPEGSVEVRRLRADGTPRHGGNTVVLPAWYVAEHLDLGYAVTAHGAQGMTVDTTHVLVTSTMTRENVYVALTRGRSSNVAYVATDRPDGDHTPPSEEVTPQQVLYGVLAHVGAEPSARQAERAEHERWDSIAQWAAEYEHIAQVAQRPRWGRLVAAALTVGGLRPADVADALDPDATGADAFDALCAELRRAEAYGYDVERVLPALAARRTLLDADSPCAVLHTRLERPTARPVATPVLVAGLIPEALRPLPDDVRTALDERADLIEETARDLAEAAMRDREPWVGRALGGEATSDADLDTLATVAAYRDRYAIKGTDPLGPEPTTLTQRADLVRARAAISRQSTRRTSDGAVSSRHIVLHP
ncbi:relaxase domain-containing protein [Antribacter sp. KLBMP9083]|uniref:Relaxase domain-containing protein n=1 Tax=Antribacter soli TaxID=2910976 RepID=A0AA41U7F7_9MICO|nr:MobF family relaxase [Antribacter soli]MCF4122008.1 relaxase domain-containing protein [Antribacter soli]